MSAWDWKTNDAFKTCSYCGYPVKHVGNATTVGMCATHEKIWLEDIATGFKKNRLRDIMIERGQIIETKSTLNK